MKTLVYLYLITVPTPESPGYATRLASFESLTDCYRVEQKINHVFYGVKTDKIESNGWRTSCDFD